MKQHLLLYLFSLLLVPGTTRATGIQLFQGTWQEALAESARSDKHLLLQASTEWCGWCRVVDREIFTDSTVGVRVNDSFIAIELDFEKGIGPDLAMKFRVGSYPTTLFFNPSGQLVHTLVGYPGGPDAFLEACDSALAVTEEQPYAFNSRDLSVPFPDFYRGSFNGGGGFGSATPEEEVVISFLNEQQDLFDEVSWSVLWRFGGGLAYESIVLEEFDEYVRRYGIDQVRFVARRLLSRLATEAADRQEREGLEEVFFLLDNYNLSDNPSLAKLGYEEFYWKRVGEWSQYVAIAWEILKLEDKENPEEIADLCRTVSQECNDQTVLQQALRWMELPLSKEPANWNYLQTHITLLYKLGRFDQAATEAQQAIELGKERGEETSELQRILKVIAGQQGEE